MGKSKASSASLQKQKQQQPKSKQKPPSPHKRNNVQRGPLDAVLFGPLKTTRPNKTSATKSNKSNAQPSKHQVKHPPKSHGVQQPKKIKPWNHRNGGGETAAQKDVRKQAKKAAKQDAKVAARQQNILPPDGFGKPSQPHHKAGRSNDSAAATKQQTTKSKSKKRPRSDSQSSNGGASYNVEYQRAYKRQYHALEQRAAWHERQRNGVTAVATGPAKATATANGAANIRLPQLQQQQTQYIPWMKSMASMVASAESSSGSASNRSRKLQRIIAKQQSQPQSTSLPPPPPPPPVIASIAPIVWQRLDDELQQFAAYVGLTDSEQRVRSQMVSHITQLATKLFPNTAVGRHTVFDASNNFVNRPCRPSVHCQVFGSFATLAICTFQSDIDLALWGVIETPTLLLPPLVRAAMGLSNTNVDIATTATTATNSKRTTVSKQVDNRKVSPAPVAAGGTTTTTANDENGKKESMAQRKLRWQAALAAIDDANGHHQQVDEEVAAVSATVESKSQNGKDESKTEVVVIDDEETSQTGAVVDESVDHVTNNASVGGSAVSSSTDVERAEEPFFVIDCVGDASLAPLVPTCVASESAPLPTPPQALPKIDNENTETLDLSDLIVIDRVGDSSMVELERPCTRDDDESPTRAGTETLDLSEFIVIDTVGDSSMLGKEQSTRLDESQTTVDTSSELPQPTSSSSASLDENDENDDNSDDDDDDNTDDADPLESLLLAAKRHATKAASKRCHEIMNASYFHDLDFDENDYSSSDDEVEMLNRYNGRGQDDDEKEEEKDNNDECSTSLPDMQVSFISNAATATTLPLSTLSSAHGPKGRIRDEVIRALASLSNKLRKSSYTNKLQLIKKARVPIIKVETCFGFEADIAVGGHNGADTSLYAASQVQKFQSFSPVVLFLKALLAQHNLDEPFSGGLGSYKLYVLVADHLERHMAAKGRDRPGEVLLSFFYRYGCDGSTHPGTERHVTKLNQHRLMSTYDGSTTVDLSNVFKLQACIHLFRLCWDRLWEGVNDYDDPSNVNGSNRPKSESTFLASLVCPIRLSRERQAKLNAVSSSASRARLESEQSSAAPLNNDSAAAPPRKKPKLSPKCNPASALLRDRTSGELMAGYGVTSLAGLP